MKFWFKFLCYSVCFPTVLFFGLLSKTCDATLQAPLYDVHGLEYGLSESDILKLNYLRPILISHMAVDVINMVNNTAKKSKYPYEQISKLPDDFSIDLNVLYRFLPFDWNQHDFESLDCLLDSKEVKTSFVPPIHINDQPLSSIVRNILTEALNSISVFIGNLLTNSNVLTRIQFRHLGHFFALNSLFDNTSDSNPSSSNIILGCLYKSYGLFPLKFSCISLKNEKFSAYCLPFNLFWYKILPTTYPIFIYNILRFSSYTKELLEIDISYKDIVENSLLFQFFYSFIPLCGNITDEDLKNTYHWICELFIINPLAMTALQNYRDSFNNENKSSNDQGIKNDALNTFLLDILLKANLFNQMTDL